MVKLGFSPTNSAWRRRIFAPIEWNVPIQGKPSGNAGQRLDALAHLARRLVGEGDGEDFLAARAADGEDMGDAGGQHPGLADAGAGEHQHRPVERLDGAPLLGIERPGSARASEARARSEIDARAQGGRVRTVRTSALSIRKACA